ncbi:peptidoglycan-binding protein [Pseudomonas putida]|uniref:peptidoglycan-binding domain-containing protein n=1 Tax=Pseudomonas putida TaxID=303 RepID=UPI0037FCC121
MFTLMKGRKVVAAVCLVMFVSTLEPASAQPQDIPQGSIFTPLGKQLIAELQVALFGRNYYHGEIDGLFGSETQEAIYLLQMEQALPVTGSINAQVLKGLDIDPPAWLPH